MQSAHTRRVVEELSHAYGLFGWRSTHSLDADTCVATSSRPSAFVYFPAARSWDCLEGEGVSRVAPVYRPACACASPPPYLPPDVWLSIKIAALALLLCYCCAFAARADKRRGPMRPPPPSGSGFGVSGLCGKLCGVLAPLGWLFGICCSCCVGFVRRCCNEALQTNHDERYGSYGRDADWRDQQALGDGRGWRELDDFERGGHPDDYEFDSYRNGYRDGPSYRDGRYRDGYYSDGQEGYDQLRRSANLLLSPLSYRSSSTHSPRRSPRRSPGRVAAERYHSSLSDDEYGHADEYGHRSPYRASNSPRFAPHPMSPRAVSPHPMSPRAVSPHPMSPPRDRLLERGTLTVHLHRATGLISMDSNGLSDPYVKLILCGTERRSSVVKRSLEPTWDETFKFVGVLRELLAEPMQLHCLDRDYGSRDDKLGHAAVDLRALAHASGELELSVPLSLQGAVHLRASWRPDAVAAGAGQGGFSASGYPGPGYRYGPQGSGGGSGHGSGGCATYGRGGFPGVMPQAQAMRLMQNAGSMHTYYAPAYAGSMTPPAPAPSPVAMY